MTRSFLKGLTRPELWAVLEAAGIQKNTPKQLNYWGKIGILQPFSLNRRCSIYSFSDVMRVALVMEMEKAGVPLQRSKGVLDFIYAGRLLSEGMHLMIGPDEVLDVDDLGTVLQRLDGVTPWKYVFISPVAICDRVHLAWEKVAGLDRFDWSDLQRYGLYPKEAS